MGLYQLDYVPEKNNTKESHGLERKGSIEYFPAKFGPRLLEGSKKNSVIFFADIYFVLEYNFCTNVTVYYLSFVSYCLLFFMHESERVTLCYIFIVFRIGKLIK